MYTRRHSLPDSGFTLIELSIVLVIIGLLVGGILVGRDMIHSAEIRSTVSQIDKFNTAVNTFRLKFNALPGDISPNDAGAFGLFKITTGFPGQAGNGDGNGVLEGGGVQYTEFAGETAVFWRHLSDANLIEVHLGSALTTAGYLPADTTAATISTYLPQSKLSGNDFTVDSAAGQNYFLLGGFGVGLGYISLLPTSGDYYNIGYNLTPLEAYSIDQKTDDGNALTGTIVEVNLTVTGLNYANLSTPAVTASCANGTGSYILTLTNRGCLLRIQMQ